ncbi:MAG: DUF429 domain-containing protein [Sulfurovum sp.]|nr:DUF429 domain-containing protein [Sulfurovum sp.]
MSKKYIGVDLGAWYSKKNKTSIVILEDTGTELKINQIISNESEMGDIEEKVELKDYEEKNEKLKKLLLCEGKGTTQTIIGIDAPFTIPAKLSDKDEIYYGLTYRSEKLKQHQNPYLFDNSARFVLNTTKQTVLAPCATLVGSLTARMKHIVDEYTNSLNMIFTPINLEENGISTIEVFPTATLYQIIKNTSLCKTDYIKAYTKEEKEKDDFTKIISYKNDKWNEKNKNRMIALIQNYICNLNDKINEIKSDDDYDAIICALTAYFVNKKEGYLKPKKEDIEKFTNSFIYVPSDESIKCSLRNKNG